MPAIGTAQANSRASDLASMPCYSHYQRDSLKVYFTHLRAYAQVTNTDTTRT